jgi:thymidylate synthase (FAD)
MYITKRMISPGAEEFMGMKFPMLDHGYIKLVDYLGCDNTVVAAARHSYDKGLDQDDTIGNEKLINFLMRSKHTSPFEQPAMVFEVKAPIMVFREWHRHRTGKLNEQSARYSQLAREFYVPALDRVQVQSTTNKQGSGASLSADQAQYFRERLAESCNYGFDVYEEAIKAGIAKELCRLMLPVNTYSTMVFQSDMSNWMNFLRLRSAPSAQYEIRVYAEQICKVMAEAFPVIWAAFEEFVLKSISLSGSELALLKVMIEDSEFVAAKDIERIWKKLGIVMEPA